MLPEGKSIYGAPSEISGVGGGGGHKFGEEIGI